MCQIPRYMLYLNFVTYSLMNRHYYYPILQVWKLRLKEVECFTNGHTVGRKISQSGPRGSVLNHSAMLPSPLHSTPLTKHAAWFVLWFSSRNTKSSHSPVSQRSDISQLMKIFLLNSFTKEANSHTRTWGVKAAGHSRLGEQAQLLTLDKDPKIQGICACPPG